MSKLSEKKERIITRLKELEQEIQHEGKISSLDELHYRDLLLKLKNYDKSLLRHTKTPKNEVTKEYRYFSDFYIDYLKAEYEHLRSRFNLTDPFTNFEKKQRAQLLEFGLKTVLEKQKILQDVFYRQFAQTLPDHPKDEHPLTRGVIRKFVIHAGPTNSGKTHHSIEQLKQVKNGLFLAPLRLLALEIYERLNAEGVPCSLKTGEEEIDVPKSTHISSTIEKADFNNFFDLVVIDEGQMIADKQRGNAWLRAILGIMASEIHICCSLNSVPLLTQVINDCEDELEVIYHERTTPLIVESREFEFPRDVQPGDALIVFSRKEALKTAALLYNQGHKPSIIYGNLPPQNRRRQVDRFLAGETDVVVSTDAIGMGLNLPIKRIIFLATEKYDGTDDRDLTTQEVKQIAGRAGRRNLYPEGYVSSTERLDFVKRSIEAVDIPLEKAVIRPLESTILQLEFGTLKEKMEYWTLFNYQTPYIEKADISEQLSLIETIPPNYMDQLSDEDLYRAIHVPFNYKNKELVENWLYYIREVTEYEMEFSVPEIDLECSLTDLETLYHKIDLYYSFSKSFRKDYDKDWIDESREIVSDEIHKKLLKNLQKSIDLLLK